MRDAVPTAKRELFDELVKEYTYATSERARRERVFESRPVKSRIQTATIKPCLT